MDPQLESVIQAATQHLAAGEIILCPTDTVWGLSADALNEYALHRINDLKDRPQGKAFILLFADVSALLSYYKGALALENIFARYQDRPTSFILQHIQGLPEALYAPDSSVAIRIPDYPLLHQLLLRYPHPLVSTSANVSGAPAPACYSDIDPAIIAGADHIVPYALDKSGPERPSRLIMLQEDGNSKVLRD